MASDGFHFSGTKRGLRRHVFKSHKLSRLIMSDRSLWWIERKNRNQKQTGLYGFPTHFLSECRVPHPRVEIMPHMHNHLSYTYYRKWGSRAIIVLLHETKCACTLMLFPIYFQMRKLDKVETKCQPNIKSK